MKNDRNKIKQSVSDFFIYNFSNSYQIPLGSSLATNYENYILSYNKLKNGIGSFIHPLINLKNAT